MLLINYLVKHIRNIPGNTSQNCESVLKQKADSKKQQYQGKQYQLK